MKNFEHKSVLTVYDSKGKVIHKKEYINEKAMNDVIKKYENMNEHYIISTKESD